MHCIGYIPPISFLQIVHEMLREHQVDVVFGYPGGAILPVYDAIHESPHFKFVLPRAEGGGGHMAEGYARVTGKPGVLLVTSGPGATNLVTPLADALMDGTPLVALTGQVATAVIGTDAFQEADVVGITRPCTKWNTMVKDVRDIPRAINEAFVSAAGLQGYWRAVRGHAPTPDCFHVSSKLTCPPRTPTYHLSPAPHPAGHRHVRAARACSGGLAEGRDRSQAHGAAGRDPACGAARD